MTNNAIKIYKELEDYINKDVATYATKINNVESVRCARRGEHIFMELIHEDGDVRYFDCTSLDQSSVGIMIGCIIANSPVNREIKDRNARKEIRSIFKMGEC